MSPASVYCLLFFLSFTILSLQVTLATLLTSLILSPFLAVSFAFIGLTLASVFVYARQPSGKEDLKKEIFNNLFLLGLLLAFCPLAIKYFVQSLYINRVAGHFLAALIGSSISIGLLFSMLFFFFGMIYALIYKYYSVQATRLYFFDLSGAALGCIFPVLILNFMQLSSVFILFSCLNFTFLTVFVNLRKNGAIKAIAAFCLIASLGFFLFNTKTNLLEFDVGVMGWRRYQDKDYKLVWHKWNIYSKTSLYAKEVPGHPLKQYKFSIVGGLSSLDAYHPEAPCVAPSERMHAATLAFLLKPPKDILILLAGAGKDMLLADRYSCGSSDITGVELNPLIVKKAENIPGYHLDEFFKKKNIHMVIAEARSYVESIDKKFDAIIIPNCGATNLQYLGIDAHTAQYLYTKEAFESYFKHLKPGGIIGILSLNKFKMAATAKGACDHLGIRDISRKVILIDTIQNINKGYNRDMGNMHPMKLVIKNTNFTEGEIARIRPKLLEKGMDWIYNPYYTRRGFEVFEELLKSRDTIKFLSDLSRREDKNYSFSTDDMPFIANMFSLKSIFSIAFWSSIVTRHFMENTNLEALSVKLNIFAIVFIIVLFLVGTVLFFLPLIFSSKIRAKEDFSVLGYFSTIGIGFTFTEITMMHAFTLLMGNPVYSFLVVLSSMLFSAGIGSFSSEYLFKRNYLNIRKLSLITFAAFCMNLYFIYRMSRLLSLNFTLRVLATLGLVCTIGFCLGMFFPQGLKRLSSQRRELIPWAWGINGYMSIVGSALSIYLCRTMGFSSLIVIAAFLYLFVWVFEK